MTVLIWCKRCQTEAIEVHPDNVEAESSVCWGCYPEYHKEQLVSWWGTGVTSWTITIGHTEFNTVDLNLLRQERKCRALDEALGLPRI